MDELVKRTRRKTYIKAMRDAAQIVQNFGRDDIAKQLVQVTKMESLLPSL